MSAPTEPWSRAPRVGPMSVFVGLVLFGLAGVTEAQVAPKTPMISAPQAEKNYPDGKRLRARYEEHKGGVKLSAVRPGMTAAAIGSAAAAEGQKRLRSGFTLQRGETFQIIEDVPQPSGGPAAPTPGTAPSAASTGARRQRGQAKFITLHRVEYRSIPLSKGSDYLTVVSEDGRLLFTRERSFPVAVNATRATVTKEAAVNLARQAAGGAFTARSTKVSEPMLEIWVDDKLQGHLTWTFTMETDSLVDPQGRQYWISALAPARVLNWESTIYHTHFGTVTGTLWETSPFQPTTSNPLAEIEVDRTGAGGGSVVTGDDGRYAFPAGTGPATLAATLSGPESVIQNLAGAVMTRSQNGTPATPIDLNFGASGEFETAQVTAFYWTTFAHGLAHTILALGDLPSLPTRVNINSTCNAFWNGSSINFFRAGGGCPNTAYSDVILHEYGHGVDQRKGGILDGGYSEGYGDAQAVLGTRQPCVGRDFFGPGTCLRPATDLIMWPPASGEDVHDIGRRYAGFTWELVQQLKQTFSEDEAFKIATRLVLGAAAANPSDIPDAVHLSFVADDNDGDLSTCSPHFKELAAAADSRNIPRPPNCVAQSGVPQIQVPSGVAFGLTCGGSTSQATLQVCNTGGANLSVGPITSSNPQFAVITPSGGYPVVISPTFCFPFIVTFTPTAAGPQTAALTIPSDDPVHPSVTVQATAQGGVGSLGLSPDLRFPPTVIQSLGACQSLRPLLVSNTGTCNLTITNVALGGANASDFSLSGLPAFPITLEPGHVVGSGALNTVFAPTALARERTANVTVTFVSDPTTGTTSNQTRQLCGEGVRTGARVLVTQAGVPMPQVHEIELKRLGGHFGFAKEVDEVRNVPLQTVTPTAGTACAPFQFHREYGGVSNPEQLVPGVYRLKVEAIIAGKEERKTVWFSVDTCGFDGTIGVDF
jgi:hypothetical protein